ncbi:SPOR domain-containing protein [Microbacterium phosphatis]|uniref:SPOR domain-containing protein n=1 Tax=Microbacterium phosphatis TaxID=3140248 RepID=UPI003140BD06
MTNEETGLPADQWWFNSRTGEVEHGPESPSIHRIGPFDTQEEAARAPQKLQERAKAWADDEARENNWGERS